MDNTKCRNLEVGYLPKSQRRRHFCIKSTMAKLIFEPDIKTGASKGQKGRQNLGLPAT